MHVLWVGSGMLLRVLLRRVGFISTSAETALANFTLFGRHMQTHGENAQGLLHEPGLPSKLRPPLYWQASAKS